MQSELKPTSIPVYGAGDLPLQVSRAYDASAALTWPGMSISGTTSTNRVCAYATSARYWRWL